MYAHFLLNVFVYKQRFRKAISCHYANSGCYFIDVKGTLQEEIAEEIENVSKRRGAILSFNVICLFVQIFLVT